MTELKTLKDISSFEENNNQEDSMWVNRECLRAEALKWVKEFSMKTAEGFEMSNTARAFKHFFNLTEEAKEP